MITGRTILQEEISKIRAMLRNEISLGYPLKNKRY